MTNDAKPPVFVLDSNLETRRSISNWVTGLGGSVRMFASLQELMDVASLPKLAFLIVNASDPQFDLKALRSELQQRGHIYSIVCTLASGDLNTATQLMRHGAFAVFHSQAQSDGFQRLVLDALQLAHEELEFARTSDEVVGRFRKFSQRDREVFALIVDGRTNKEIATTLDISLRTVEHRRCRIYEKSETNSLPELIRLAMQARCGIRHDDLVEWIRSGEFPKRKCDNRVHDPGGSKNGDH